MLAVLFWPPDTDEAVPLAVLLSPPDTEEKRPKLLPSPGCTPKNALPDEFSSAPAIPSRSPRKVPVKLMSLAPMTTTAKRSARAATFLMRACPLNSRDVGCFGRLRAMQKLVMYLYRHPRLMKRARLHLRTARSLWEKVVEQAAYATPLSRSKRANQPLRVVIFGQGRTGSTLLEDLLCSACDFRSKGELLTTARREVASPLRFVRGVAAWRRKKRLIFHVKPEHLTRNRKRPVDPAAFMEALHAEGWKILHLRRRNKVRHCLSGFVAQYRGHYHTLDSEPDDVRLRIDCQKFVRKMKVRLGADEIERASLANVPYHEVIYEDDLERAESHQATVDRVLAYLALPPGTTSTRHRRNNPQTPPELIVNYDEFIACLTRHGWQTYIDS